MKLNRNLVVLSCLVMLAATGLFAQGTTGGLEGTVTQGGAPLPGVTVSIAAPTLQGTRTSVTNEGGSYSFPAIPPGEYTVTFSLAGLQDVSRKASVNLVQTARLNADMKLSSVTEAITVTANATQVMETTTIETNLKQATVNRLPINRNPTAQSSLAPGVTAGVNGNSISGAASYDNLYLVNGAVVNENLRGQSHALYIEDAIQETTVLTAGISAEYGRFTGGVVSSITKSGGNDFSGSVRDTVDNPKWTSKSVDTQVTPINHRNNTYEETLGGRIIRDRLWFFVAGRQAKVSANRTLGAIATLPNPTIGAYTVSTTSPRVEAKLTGNITDKHSVTASYLTNNVKGDKNCQIGCLDLRSINNDGVENPNNFKTLHYNGVITNNFLIEADGAKKYFAFVGFGGNTPAHVAQTAADYALGTPIIDQVVTGQTFNAPYFCGSCGAELRNNKEWDIKGRYFLGTKSFGTHNLVVGYDDWAEQRNSNNYQSPTDFRYDVRAKAPIQQPDGTVQISLKGDPNGNGDRFLYFPVAFASLGSNLKTNSVFLNDKWDLNKNFTFNLGARYDKNDAKDSAGHPVSKDSKVSPRLGAIYDVFGNGRLRLDANYGIYVGRLAETVAGQGSGAGNPSTIRFAYAGPDTGYLDSRVALQQAFQWFLDNGFTNRAIISQSIPGFNTKLLQSGIQSPNAKEVTFGAASQIGKGYIRADYVHRNFQDFYAQFNTLGIGTVINPATGAPSDLNLIGNSSVPTRKYWAAEFAGQYQLPAGFGVGGNYTYSKLRGNVEGETIGSGPVTFAASTVSYSEFQSFNQNAPIGYLQADQRHKARLFVSSDIGTPIGHFNIGLIERFDSGSPFSAVASIPVTAAMLCSNGATNTACTNGPAGTTGNPIYPNGSVRDPGAQYANRPPSVTYFFSDRGQFRWDKIISTDLALNYELPVRNLGFFAKGEVRNAFNHKATTSGSTTVNTNTQNSSLAPFNPFTDTPKQCPTGTAAADCKAMGANYQFASNFGQAIGTPTTFTQNGNYQLPRTYLFSAGLRF